MSEPSRKRLLGWAVAPPLSVLAGAAVVAAAAAVVAVEFGVFIEVFRAFAAAGLGARIEGHVFAGLPGNLSWEAVPLLVVAAFGWIYARDGSVLAGHVTGPRVVVAGVVTATVWFVAMMVVAQVLPWGTSDIVVVSRIWPRPLVAAVAGGGVWAVGAAAARWEDARRFVGWMVVGSLIAAGLSTTVIVAVAGPSAIAVSPAVLLASTNLLIVGVAAPFGAAGFTEGPEFVLLGSGAPWQFDPAGDVTVWATSPAVGLLLLVAAVGAAAAAGWVRDPATTNAELWRRVQMFAGCVVVSFLVVLPAATIYADGSMLGVLHHGWVGARGWPLVTLVPTVAVVAVYATTVWTRSEP